MSWLFEKGNEKKKRKLQLSVLRLRGVTSKSTQLSVNSRDVLSNCCGVFGKCCGLFLVGCTLKTWVYGEIIKVEDYESKGAISLCGVGDALPRHFGGFIRFELRTKNF